MADDPYKVLGVARDASDEDIRRAFRRLAKELHPDLNPNNRTGAEERFKRVSGAYDIVGDPERRRKFDRGEIDASGEARRTYQRAHAGAGRGGANEDFGFSSIFEDLFAGRGSRDRGAGFSVRGQDVRYSLEVEFVDAVAGARKRVTLPDGGALDLVVPEGVEEGQVLRLKSKGSAGINGGEAGDALVEIKVRPHPYFRRVGNDIAIEVPITIDEAVLGAKIEVPTVGGRVAVNVPKGASSGSVLRLKGKGVRDLASGTSGDILVTLTIVLPPKIDEALAYFLSEWRQKNGYDPGRP